jgi:CRISPR-associated protein Csb2
MGIHKRVVGDPARVSPKFSGKDATGRPLKGHRHLYLLPLDRDRDGRIDHLIAVSKQPLDRDEQIALDRVASLWQPHGKPDIRFVPLQWGRIEDLFSVAKFFRSATPFVPPRHYRTGRGSFTDWLAKEVAREATNHGLPVPVRVVALPALVQRDGRRMRWIEFRRSRKGADARLGFGFQLEFAEPTCGPIALGYGCHFGLGLFTPENAAAFG